MKKTKRKRQIKKGTYTRNRARTSSQTKTHRRNRTKSSRRVKTHKRYRNSRASGFTKKQVVERDKFRNVFITDFNNLEKALESNDKTNIKQQMSKFKANIATNKVGVNTLIPMTVKSRPIQKVNLSSKQEETTLETFVPFLVIIFKNVNNDIIRNEFVRVFKKNTGDINLKSPIKDISALSTAIELNDTNLVLFLLSANIGADKNILTEEQKVSLDNLLQRALSTAIELKDKNLVLSLLSANIGADKNILTEEQKVLLDNLLRITTEETVKKESFIEPVVSLPVPIVKLDIPTELPAVAGYAPDVEPEFWRTLFGENELTTLREKIRNMIENDDRIPFTEGTREISQTWSICKIIQTIIPTYHVPIKNDPYTAFGNFISDLPIDFSRFNITLCAALLIYGIISHKMIGQDYSLLFKGGKAVQLVLSNIPEMSTYETEDIDVLVMSNVDITYDEIKIKNLAGHVSYLIKWFLNNQDIEKNYNSISVMPPDPANKRANPYIFKLSYVKSNKKYNPRTRTQVDDFKQFSDVDFKDIPEGVRPYFDSAINYPFDISELDTKVLFRCPNIGALLDEKIYYFSKYIELKGILTDGKPITEPGYETTTIADCERYLEKFKRSILAMNNGLERNRADGLTPIEHETKERNSIERRLKKIKVTDPNIIKNVLVALYPIKQENIGVPAKP